MRLDIGSGTNPAAGYTTVDAYESADIPAPMGALPLPDHSVEAIYSSHALEHVGWRETVPVLREWRRVMQPGGRLVLRVPDLAWCVQHWLDNRSDLWALAKIVGSQEHEGNVHRAGYDLAGWRRCLDAAGWVILSERALWTHEQQTLEFVCIPA